MKTSQTSKYIMFVDYSKVWADAAAFPVWPKREPKDSIHKSMFGARFAVLSFLVLRALSEECSMLQTEPWAKKRGLRIFLFSAACCDGPVRVPRKWKMKVAIRCYMKLFQLWGGCSLWGSECSFTFWHSYTDTWNILEELPDSFWLKEQQKVLPT